MHRIVLVPPLAILPIQFGCAAAAGCCRHETGGAAKQFGHYEHQHRVASGDVSKDLKDLTTTAVAGADDDYSICHLSAAQILVTAQVHTAPPVAAPPRFVYQLSYTSHVPIGLERAGRSLAG